MTEKLTVGMISLGCTKNRVDSEIALGVLKEHGYQFTGDPAEADILLVNTCGFIGPAKEESIDTIIEMAEYKQTGRCRLLVVTGCLAQRYEESLMAEMPEIDLLMGVNQYEQLPAAIEKALKGKRQSLCADDYGYFEHGRVLTTPPYSSYIRIGDGCSNRCTYCAIPLIRGPYRSRPMDRVLGEIRDLAKGGVREHIIVAQDTTRYGTDWQQKSALPELMDKAAQIEGVDWLRVLYCYPDETDAELLEVMAKHDNICKYLDLPIQHINDDLLRAMNRRGTSVDIRRGLRLARERGFMLRTSIIVGFPGETDAQFEELMDFIAEAEFDRMGAFTFSPEDDTPAALMPNQIPEEVKQERLDRLMKLQAEISLKRNLMRVGTTERVLVTDIGDDGMILGRSQFEAPDTDGEILFTAAKTPTIGEFVNVRIIKADTYDLMGVMV